MKTWCVVLVAVAQLGLLAFMAGEREWVLRTGRTVYLRTAPIDPRDPMRGDYVRLGYEIASVPAAACRDELVEWIKEAEKSHRRTYRDRRVYAVLEVGGDGVGRIVTLSNRKPRDGVVLRGRIAWINTEGVQVRFGIEAFFMQQGKALEFEREQRERVGLPLNIEAALSDEGLAVIRGWRWESLGLTTAWDPPVETIEARREGKEVPAPGLVVELKNWSDRPVTIASDLRARLRLAPVEREWAKAEYRWVGAERAAPEIRAVATRVLQPGESYRETIDLREREWFVFKTEEGATTAKSLLDLENHWNAAFCVEYEVTEVPQSGANGTPKLEAVKLRSPPIEIGTWVESLRRAANQDGL